MYFCLYFSWCSIASMKRMQFGISNGVDTAFCDGVLLFLWPLGTSVANCELMLTDFSMNRMFFVLQQAMIMPQDFSDDLLIICLEFVISGSWVFRSQTIVDTMVVSGSGP